MRESLRSATLPTQHSHNSIVIGTKNGSYVHIRITFATITSMIHAMHFC